MISTQSECACPAGKKSIGLCRCEPAMIKYVNDLIAAAYARATLYDDDDRQDIKEDVMNAFFAGADFVRRRSEG